MKRSIVIAMVIMLICAMTSNMGVFAKSDESTANTTIEAYSNDTEETVGYIHLNNLTGNDVNDGLSAESSVQSFERAKELINDGDIILVESIINVTQDETWDLSSKPNSKLQRNVGGVMIKVEGNHQLTLKNITIDGQPYNDQIVECDAIIKLGEPGGNAENGASLILEKNTILENNTSKHYVGGAIAGFSYNTITMDDGAIIRNNGTEAMCADFGGGISLENHGMFIMNGGSIEGNCAVRGGGISLIASSMTMNGGEIVNNSANSANTYVGHYGGGVYLANFQDWSQVGTGSNSREIAGEVNFEMNGGSISNNKATYYSGTDKGTGGGIATFPQYTKGYEKSPKINLSINGGTLKNNEAYNGGAISAYFSATVLDVKNSTISDNKALSQGGGIYDVFNALVTITNSEISSNSAISGAGIYVNSSALKMESGLINENKASKRGGGIFIANATYNGIESSCTILGGTIKGNTITDDNVGSDGIYQGKTFNLGETVLIDKSNDVYLPSGRVINVIKPLESINRLYPVYITSEDKIVESKETAGTRLVNYFDEAGGIEAATQAELNQLYIPSQYMPEGLLVGKSNADKQLNFMTYIDKSAYMLSYEFVSATKNKELPSEVTALLPKDDSKYLEDTIVTPVTLDVTSAKVTDGVWYFREWDAKSKVVNGNITFSGTWEFIQDGLIMNITPTIDAEDKTLTVGDTFDPLASVTALDTEDGDVTDKIEVLKNTVDTTKAGVFEVTYKVIDSKGASFTKTIKVTVNEINKPTTPINPEKPTTPNTSIDNSIDTPQTGDTTSVGIYIAILLLAITGMTTIALKKSKHIIRKNK